MTNKTRKKVKNNDKIDKLIAEEIKGLRKIYKKIDFYNEGREALLPKIFNTALDNNDKLDKILKYCIFGLILLGALSVVEFVKTILFLRSC
jgi:hypothetical protein